MTEFPEVLGVKDAACYLGLATSTLAKLRLSGAGPTFCKLGRRVVYRRFDLDAHLDRCQRRRTSDSSLTAKVAQVDR